MPSYEPNVIQSMPSKTDPSKPPVLLVHGAWHGAWCWEGNFLDFFAEHGFDTHAVDLRGHGASAAVKPMRWNRISDYVDDVLSVADALESPPVVIGHSMGGYVVQHLLRRTERLSGVGLLATAPSYGVYKTTLNIIRRRPRDFLKANLSLSLYPLVKDAAAAKHMFFDDDLPDETALERADRLTDESYMAFLDMLPFNIPRGPIPDVPVLVVGGGKDNVFAVNTQHHTAQKLGAECKIVAGASHDIMLSKHWEEAAQHFLSWMGSASR